MQAHDTKSGAKGRLTLGDWTLDLGTQRVMQGSTSHPLNPKEIAVLQELIHAAPDLVRTQELLDRVWPDVVVNDHAVHEVVGRLRRYLGDNARRPSYIETLPKRGYRLLASVEACESDQDSGLSAKWRQRRILVPGLALALSVLALVSASLLWLSRDVEPTFNSLSVTPFRTVGTRSEVIAFSDAVLVDLRDALSETTLTIVDSSTARFRIGGTVRQVEGGKQINVELIRNEDGQLLWSQALIETGSGFGHANYVARRVNGLLSEFIAAYDFSDPESEAAREAYLAARLEWNRITYGEGNYRVYVEHLERALRLDSEYSDAIKSLADAYIDGHGSGDTAAQARVARDLVRRHLTIEPETTFFVGKLNYLLDLDYPSGIKNLEYGLRRPENNGAYGYFHLELCRAHWAQGDDENALSHCESAVSYGVSQLQQAAYTLMGNIHLHRGRYEQALSMFELSRSMSADRVAVPLIGSAKAYYYLGDESSANAQLEQALRIAGQNRSYIFPGILALLGHEERARALLAQNEHDFPTGKIGWWSMVNSESFHGHLYLGDLDAAFQWVEYGISNRSLELIAALRSPIIIDSLKDDQRYLSAMKRLVALENQGTRTPSVATASTH